MTKDDEKPAPHGRPVEEAKLKAPRYQPSKAELNEPIHLPGRSPEAVAKIVTQGGAPRREPEKTED